MAFAQSTPTIPDGAFAAPYGDNYFSSNGFGVGDITGLYGSNVGQPGEAGQFQGHETFTVYNADDNPIGTFAALVGYNYGDADPHVQILVTEVTPTAGVTVGTGDGQLPQVGSVFDYGHSMTSPAWTYASLAAQNSHDSTYATAGQGDIVHSNYQSFNASAHVDVHQLLEGAMALPGGGYLMADDSPETYTGISNTAPFASTVQGLQVYDVYDASGAIAGKVNAITISTADLVGGNSQEVFVTGYPDGTSPDVEKLLPVGSVINYLNYFGFASSVYYDIPGTGAGGANDMGVMWNLLGGLLKLNTASSFDAVKGFTDGTPLFADPSHGIADNPTGAIPFLNGTTIVPTHGLIGYTDASDNYYTGINGIPNGGVSGNNTDVQSFQHFVLTGLDENGNPVADPFTAYVTAFGNDSVFSQTMYITGLGDGAALPNGLSNGSTIEYASHGWYDTLVVNTDPTGLGDGDGDSANEVTQMLSIPLLGGAWTEAEPSSEFWLSLIGITF